MSTFRETLLGACGGLTEQQVERMEAFAAYLIEENQKVNLTAITDEKEVALRHFADSLLPLTLGFGLEGKCVDIGTGAGFPGVPLAICGVSVTLLDSLRKRTDFLTSARAQVGFDAEIRNIRAEDFGRDAQSREQFDWVFSRAVAPLTVLAELMLPLLRVGGRALAWKGPRAAVELAEAEYALETLGAQAQTLATAQPWGERTIIVITKKRSTDAKYPRKAGKPAKNPLKV